MKMEGRYLCGHGNEDQLSLLILRERVMEQKRRENASSGSLQHASQVIFTISSTLTSSRSGSKCRVWYHWWATIYIAIASLWNNMSLSYFSHSPTLLACRWEYLPATSYLALLQQRKVNVDCTRSVSPLSTHHDGEHKQRTAGFLSSGRLARASKDSDSLS